MNTKQAWRIVGNQPKWALRNMITALETWPDINTPANNERLQAAKIAVKTNNPRYEA